MDVNRSIYQRRSSPTILQPFTPQGRIGDWETPLHQAAIHSDETLCLLLLEAGADATAKDKVGGWGGFGDGGTNWVWFTWGSLPEMSDNIDNIRT